MKKISVSAKTVLLTAIVILFIVPRMSWAQVPVFTFTISSSPVTTMASSNPVTTMASSSPTGNFIKLTGTLAAAGTGAYAVNRINKKKEDRRMKRAATQKALDNASSQ